MFLKTEFFNEISYELTFAGIGSGLRFLIARAASGPQRCVKPQRATGRFESLLKVMRRSGKMNGQDERRRLFVAVTQLS